MSPVKRYVSPPVKEYVKKLPFNFCIDRLIVSWDYVADSNNFDHEGFKHNQLSLTSSIYEYDGKNIWYEGTGSTMTETGLGFTPSFLMIKSIDSTDNWIMYDSFRGFGSSGNTDGAAVYANLTNAENSSEVGITVSSGQFVMNNSNDNVNKASTTYIYAAFA